MLGEEDEALLDARQAAAGVYELLADKVLAAVGRHVHAARVGHVERHLFAHVDEELLGEVGLHVVEIGRRQPVQVRVQTAALVVALELVDVARGVERVAGLLVVRRGDCLLHVDAYAIGDEVVASEQEEAQAGREEHERDDEQVDDEDGDEHKVLAHYAHQAHQTEHDRHGAEREVDDNERRQHVAGHVVVVVERHLDVAGEQDETQADHGKQQAHEVQRPSYEAVFVHKFAHIVSSLSLSLFLCFFFRFVFLIVSVFFCHTFLVCNLRCCCCCCCCCCGEDLCPIKCEWKPEVQNE